MSGKLSLSVYDDVHQQFANGIEYDFWRIIDSNNRVNLKHDQFNENSRPHLLIQANRQEDLGSFEVVLYVKDYFQNLDKNFQINDSRLMVPVGINRLDQDCHLNVHITPTGYTCTL